MIVKNLLYIYQGEGYSASRFLNYVYHNLKWYNLQKRNRLEWTKKASLIYILTIGLFFGLLIFALVFLTIKLLLLLLLIEIFLFPYLMVVTGFLVSPVDLFLKNRIKLKAKVFIDSVPNLKVIGITGSYGKTTTKEILALVLSQKFKIVKTPDNINTDLGIANFILANKSILSNSNYFIVEMGAYRVGDIKDICQMVSPAYSILTGINTAHIERFGNLENTIKAKFELPQSTVNTTYLNIDDKNIAEKYKNFSLSNVVTFSINEASNIVALDNFNGLTFNYNNKLFKFELIARHAVGLAIVVIKISLELGLNFEEIGSGLDKVKIPDHRLKVMRNLEKNITIIDDSYNGNYHGFLSGLEVIGRAKGRKVVLTPGLVEQGDVSAKIHQELGKLYAQTVDLVLLIDNSATIEIAKGLKEAGFNHVKHYKTAKEAHDDLANILQRGDTIIFQNDWSDIYL